MVSTPVTALHGSEGGSRHPPRRHHSSARALAHSARILALHAHRAASPGMPHSTPIIRPTQPRGWPPEVAASPPPERRARCTARHCTYTTACPGLATHAAIQQAALRHRPTHGSPTSPLRHRPTHGSPTSPLGRHPSGRGPWVIDCLQRRLARPPIACRSGLGHQQGLGSLTGSR